MLSVDGSTTDLVVVPDPLVPVAREEGSRRVQPRNGRVQGAGLGRRRPRHGSLMVALRRWCRCWWQTRGMHQLQLDTNRCRYCKVPWSQLYPSAETSSGNADKKTTTRLT